MDRAERKPDITVCEHQRRRPAYTYAQSDQHLCCSFLESLIDQCDTQKNQHSSYSL